MSHHITRRGLQRRQALLNAATDIFLEHGYARTTLDMIIARAGGSRRSLYEYFGDKDGLFSAVITEHASDMVGQLRDLDITPLAPRDALIRLGEAFVDALISPINLRLYRLLIGEGTAFPELGQQVYRAGPLQLFSELRNYLDCLQRNGKLPGVELDEHTVRQFIGMVKADYQLCALLSPELLPSRDEIRKHVESCVDLLLQSRSSR